MSKILEAVKTVMEECNAHPDCSGCDLKTFIMGDYCPLYKEGAPSNWVIKRKIEEMLRTEEVPYINEERSINDSIEEKAKEVILRALQVFEGEISCETGVLHVDSNNVDDSQKIINTSIGVLLAFSNDIK